MDSIFVSTQTISTAALAVAALAVVGCGLALARGARRAARHAVAVALQLEGEARDLSRDLDAAAARTNELERRLAQLESRAPQGTDSPAPAGESALARPAMTERRHRVLTLARRGLDAGAISATLDVPRGEVELIIGLNRAA